MKATAKLGKGKFLRFPLKVKNYNDLIGQRYVLRILIVVVVPKKVSEWPTQDEQALVLRRCGYWMSLADEPGTDNTTSVPVKVPRSQVFSTEALRRLLGVGGRA